MMAFKKGFVTMRLPISTEGILYTAFVGHREKVKVYLDKHVEDWCWDNLRNQPSIEGRKDKNEIKAFVIFWNDADALFFKMRWF